MKGKYLFVALLACLLFFVGCEDRDQSARRQVRATRTEVSGLREETTVTNSGQDDRLDSLETKVAELCALLGDQDGYPLVPNLDDRVANLEATVASLQSTVATVTSSLVVVEQYSSKVLELESKLAALELTDQGDWVITGVNVRIQDGENQEAPLIGKGNLLIGRDAAEDFRDFYNRDPVRSGTNNLVMGGSNEYLNDGSLIVGILNNSLSDHSVLFGCENSTTGEFCSVLGGTFNEAKGKFSVVASGQGRVSCGGFEFRANNLLQNTNTR